MLHNPPATPADLFARAATSLVDTLQGTTVNLQATPISKFKASYGEVLDNANQGRAQVIVQGKKRYLLLSEDQVIALAQHQQRPPRSLADSLRGIAAPAAPLATPSLQRRRAAASQFQLPALPTGG